MRLKIQLSLVLLFFFARGVSPAEAQTFDTLKPDHPRVLATQADFARIAEHIKQDERAAGWHQDLKNKAEAILDQPAVTYDIPDGRRLLAVSRRVADHVLTLGLLDALEPDDRYRDRIWADLEAAAAFKDWNPDHFLDVAEMAFAFGLAYDWLHDRWTPAQRKTIREAIVRHALKPALADFERNAWWTRTRINWNQVCNGGLIVAALAVADEETELAERLLTRSLAALPLSMERYAPDGGYEEGPGYWGYGTLYNVFAIAALESALGKDFGLGDMPGFDTTANFPQHMTGATGRAYNFGDSKESAVRSSAMFYLAKRYDQPGNAYNAARNARGSAIDLLWYDPSFIDGDVPTLPETAVYESAGVATIRSGWHKKTDWYLGAKGGWIGFGHSQMDLGSFILEKGGVRWLIDLGSDDYNLPGYFSAQEGGRRWSYYRNRAEGHNTLVINPDNKGGQRYDAKAPITCIDESIHIDLSQVYRGDVMREIEFVRGFDHTVVTDTIALDKPSEVWWFAHTRSRIELADDGRSAQLRQDGKFMRVEIVSPKGARFSVMDARPLPGSPDPEGQNPNNGASIINRAKGTTRVKRGNIPRFGAPNPRNAVRKLAIRLEGVTETTIQVKFSPLYH